MSPSPKPSAATSGAILETATGGKMAVTPLDCRRSWHGFALIGERAMYRHARGAMLRSVLGSRLDALLQWDTARQGGGYASFDHSAHSWPMSMPGLHFGLLNESDWKTERKDHPMAISTAVQHGSSVRVYDEKGGLIFERPSGSSPKDGLQGYTSSTVSIRTGNEVRVFSEKGAHLRTIMAQ
jgi:hypothetical protein